MTFRTTAFRISDLRTWGFRWLACCQLACFTAQPSAAQTAPTAAGSPQPVGTVPLELAGDIASQMIDGIDRFLLGQWESATKNREAAWELDLMSENSLASSLEPHRQRLAAALGVKGARLPMSNPETVTTVAAEQVAATELGADPPGSFEILAIRWPVLGDPAPQRQGLPSLWGEGLLLMPHGRPPVANVIVLGDADQTPEELAGLTEGAPEGGQLATRLAAAGCRVVIPDLVSRHREPRNGRANLTDREYLHRPAFELGRTLAGYEVQMTLALVDWMSSAESPLPIGVFGYGEGGLLALAGGGLDTRIDSVVVSGFFGPRNESWREPMERQFFGLFRDFDATESALLMAGRRLLIETSRGPELKLTGEGGTPAELRSPAPDDAEKCLEQARQRLAGGKVSAASRFELIRPADGKFGTAEAAAWLLRGFDLPPLDVAEPPPRPVTVARRGDARTRAQRRVQEIDRHTQMLLEHSPAVRERFLSRLDRTSVEAYEASVESYRDIFRDEVIGRFDIPPAPPRPRSRQTWQTDKWTGHEVVLDVFPDVIASGVLLLPNDLRPGERRPVVVCQHGLEGRPVDVFQGDHPAYHDFAAKLCENGLIVFAPQNPYLFQDRFRTLQRKAQPLGKTLFSVIVPQHQAIVDWLSDQPFVDPTRIAFYGLSYGGKTAMRVPALVTDYCLSICSADFNEWVLKNASTRHNFSYVWTGEYEIFEWDLGSTFNYAEMAALICPRPFMVERGHFDGVGEDHWVAHEYAKIRHLYAAKLGIPERTEIEWFVGPHTIHGQGSFRFLSRHLDWPIRPMGE